MKRFSKRVRCHLCGKTHYAKPSISTPNRYYAVCPKCGTELLLSGDRVTVTRVGGETRGEQEEAAISAERADCGV